jgi:hypothetical protein
MLHRSAQTKDDASMKTRALIDYDADSIKASRIRLKGPFDHRIVDIYASIKLDWSSSDSQMKEGCR